MIGEQRKSKLQATRSMALIFKYHYHLIPFKYMSAVDSTMRVREEESMGLLKKDMDPHTVLTKKRNTTEEFGDLLIMYIRNLFWVLAAVAVIYYSNFFHHLFTNPKINELFF